MDVVHPSPFGDVASMPAVDEAQILKNAEAEPRSPRPIDFEPASPIDFEPASPRWEVKSDSDAVKSDTIQSEDETKSEKSEGCDSLFGGAAGRPTITRVATNHSAHSVPDDASPRVRQVSTRVSLRSRHSLSAARASFFNVRGPSTDKKEDYSNLLSAKTLENLEHVEHSVDDDESNGKRKHIKLEPSYPLPLVIFVVLLSIVAGLVVTGVHYAIVYAGCPLGLNGCNSFIPSKESKGFFFIKWFKRVTDDKVPEDIVYISSSIVGAAILAALFHYLPEGLAFQIRGGGTIQSLVAVACGERITLQSAALRVIASAIYLGSGGTLGLDGPAIQVCCAATTFLGWCVGMRSVPTQSLLACLGFAGGFAATFNSPLAGILFAMEELQHVSSRLSKHIICVILMCSIVATAVARACQGNQQLLEANWGNELFDSVGGGSLNKVFGHRMWMLVSVPIGVLCSFVGFACSRGIRWLFDAMDKSRAWVPFGFYRHEPPAFIIGAALVASIGSFVFRTTGLRAVWGIGYESLQEAFERDFQASHYLIVAFGKLFAMVLAIVTHAPGDILEPVLIAGAFLGGSVGSFLQTCVEDQELVGQVLRPCLVFGMVGLFASCFRFPLTPVVIVLELMGVETYSLVLPAALAGFTAITTSNRLFPPLLDELMYEDGVDCHELSQEADAMAEFEATMDWAQSEEYEAEPEPEVQDRSSGSYPIQAGSDKDDDSVIHAGNGNAFAHTRSEAEGSCCRSSGSTSSYRSVAAERKVAKILSNASRFSQESVASKKSDRRVSTLSTVMHHIEAAALELSNGEGSQAYYKARTGSIKDRVTGIRSSVIERDPSRHGSLQSVRGGSVICPLSISTKHVPGSVSPSPSEPSWKNTSSMPSSRLPSSGRMLERLMLPDRANSTSASRNGSLTSSRRSSFSYGQRSPALPGLEVRSPDSLGISAPLRDVSCKSSTGHSPRMSPGHSPRMSVDVSSKAGEDTNGTGLASQLSHDLKRVQEQQKRGSSRSTCSHDRTDASGSRPPVDQSNRSSRPSWEAQQHGEMEVPGMAPCEAEQPRSCNRVSNSSIHLHEPTILEEGQEEAESQKGGEKDMFHRAISGSTPSLPSVDETPENRNSVVLS